jgi:hypothetical protein
VATFDAYAPIAVHGPTGATQATRYAGGTTSSSPGSGTFNKGDYVIAQDGQIWICTVAGSPGTWVSPTGSGGPPSGAAGGVLAGTYPNPDLNTSAAGAGLGIAANVLAVNVDNTTIEIPVDTLQLKNTAVTPGTYGSAAQVPVVTVNSKGQITSASQTSVGVAGGEVDYVEITSPVTVTATTDGNGNGTAVIDGNAITYNGSTRVKIEFYAPYAQYNVNGQNILANLYDGTTDLGRLANQTTSVSGVGPPTTVLAVNMYGARLLTPSATAHTYHIRAWKTSASGTASIGAGAGGASAYMPAWYRITYA